MAERNLSAVLHGVGDLRMEESDIPEPGPGQVLVSLSACGICGTDMAAWTLGLDPQYVTLPVVLGHECAGVVVRAGPGVSTLVPGDRVALELEVPCRRCALCREGKYNLCKPWSFGGLQRYHVYAADFCHKLPAHVSLEQGALLEPLACGVRAAVSRGAVRLGDAVLVCGAGAIGLSALLAARACGAGTVCVTDIEEYRLETARKMGATHTLLARASDSRALASMIVAEVGREVDVAIECSGAEISLQAAVYAVRRGGAVVPVGLEPAAVRLPLATAVVREVDIRGVFSYCNNYPAALSIVSSGLGDPIAMVTHRFPLSRLQEALELVRSRGDGVIKVIIDCQK